MTIPILMRRMAAALERLSMIEPGSQIYRAVLDDLRAGGVAVGAA